MERIKAKLIIIFLLLILMFYSHVYLFIDIKLTIVLLVYSVSLLLIHKRRLRSTKHEGPGLASIFGACFMTFVRIEDRHKVAHCTLEALLPLRACDLG